MNPDFWDMIIAVLIAACLLGAVRSCGREPATLRITQQIGGKIFWSCETTNEFYTHIQWQGIHGRNCWGVWPVEDFGGWVTNQGRW